MAVAPEAPNRPDRADAPISETAERFLRAVIAQLPVERIEELHLFSPLRQGTIETGIAVLAVRVPEPAPVTVGVDAEAVEAAPELALEAPEVLTVEPVEDVGPAEDVGPTEDAGPAEDAVQAEAGHAADLEAVDALEGDEPVAAAEVLAVVEPVAVPPIERHTVYTARYRLVIKGPERGKWESDVKAEADAPLITVETVVRGVQRRAGEESEIVRYSGAQIARALRVPLPMA